MKTLIEQLESAQIELELRVKHYPRRIESGQLSAITAAHQIECMESIVKTLERQKELKDAGDEMLLKPNTACNCEKCVASWKQLLEHHAKR